MSPATFSTRSTRVLVVVLCALLAAGSFSTPVDASPEERRLEQARERLGDVREDLDRAREARDEEERALEVAEERLEEVLGAVEDAEAAVERQERAVAAAEADLADLAEDADAREQRTADRIAELYREGGRSPLISVLSAESAGQALARKSYMDAINRTDRRAFEDVVASHRAVDAQAERLEQQRQSLEGVLAQQRELLAEVEDLRDDRAVALADREGQLEELESREGELDSERRDLAAAADRSSRQRADRGSRSTSPSGGSAQTASTGGGWRWPSGGTVTSEYGQRWGRLHAGIDIAAGHGAAITAARGGTVASAGRSGNFGNLVTVDHGGGVVTAYAHLSSISVSSGERVSAGQRLGGMGCTGRCTGTHLHFEVRVDGSAQNPRNFLR